MASNATAGGAGRRSIPITKLALSLGGSFLICAFAAVAGAGKTVGGLAMLMGNASKGIKKVVTNIERDILDPLLTSFYNYNMLYDPDPAMATELGWDAARELRSWHEPDVVLGLAKLVIVSRPGFPEPTVDDVRRAAIDPACVVLCGVGTPDIEATDIRRLLETGGSLDGMVDPAVEAYLRHRGLYGPHHDGRG